MRRTTIYLDPELDIRLKVESLRQKQSTAEIIRQALREYLDKQPKRLPRGMGKYDSGHTDTAERFEELLGETGFGENS